jgi:hypothetical protein
VNYVILLLAVIVMAAAFITAPPVASAEFLAEHIGYMLRLTARLAFALFLLAYIARPLAELLCSRLVLVRHRRLGIPRHVWRKAGLAYRYFWWGRLRVALVDGFNQQ